MAQATTHASGSGGRLWVPLWDWPLRVMHWLAAACIVVLIVTGFYIGKPYFFVRGDEPRAVMSWMRFLHFAAAGLLVATGIVRFYMLFAGNRFERWTALVPHTARDWKNLFGQLWYYLTIRLERAPSYLGHNPAQQVSYLAVYAVVLVMVATGFALYGQGNPGGFFDTTFSWVHAVLGGSPNTRFVHHVLTWVFLIFVPVHIYLSLSTDLMKEPGMISSMISGGRWTDAKDHADLSRDEIAALGDAHPDLGFVRAGGVAAVVGGLAGGLAFAFVQATMTLAQGGSLWPPQEVIGSVLLGREFIVTSETVPGFVLALVGIVAHGVLSIFFAVLLALGIHRLGTGAAVVAGLLAGLLIFLVDVAALASTVVGTPVAWSLLPAHLAYGAVAAATYKAVVASRS